MAAGHVGHSPGPVDEEAALGFKFELAVKPGFPLPQGIGTVLLDGVAGLSFTRDAAAFADAVQRRYRYAQLLLRPRQAQLLKRDVTARLPEHQHRLAILLDPA